MKATVTPGNRRRIKESAFEGMTVQEIIPSFRQCRGSRVTMKKYCLNLQHNQIVK